jgi:hypothetical protein
MTNSGEIGQKILCLIIADLELIAIFVTDDWCVLMEK